jgi:hypothetical protein
MEKLNLDEFDALIADLSGIPGGAEAAAGAARRHLSPGGSILSGVRANVSLLDAEYRKPMKDKPRRE